MSVRYDKPVWWMYATAAVLAHSQSEADDLAEWLNVNDSSEMRW